MDLEILTETAAALVSGGKGILAVDESTPTCNKRFEALGIETTVENRRAYRELLVMAPGLNEFIGGAILYDETLRQQTADGRSFPSSMEANGILPGIKVDTGARALAGFPGELVTEGLDGLRDRLIEYSSLGARFAKWRAVITIDEGLPSRACVEANAHALARYASLCQESGIVPIVEPEVLMDGAHGIDTCQEVSTQILAEVFDQLETQNVQLAGIILKPNMVISGLINADRATRQHVADRTVACLRENVPSTVQGIAFLSGGQGDIEATDHLDRMNRDHPDLPWKLTFSYGRALQRAALETWRGRPENAIPAQMELLERAKLNSLAATGQYTGDMERAA